MLLKPRENRQLKIGWNRCVSCVSDIYLLTLRVHGSHLGPEKQKNVSVCAPVSKEMFRASDMHYTDIPND